MHSSDAATSDRSDAIHNSDAKPADDPTMADDQAQDDLADADVADWVSEDSDGFRHRDSGALVVSAGSRD